MPLSNSISSYEDLRPAFDRALTSPKGISIKCPSIGKAVHMRQRFYKLRVLDRAKSLEIYEPGDPARGTSPWDTLSIDIAPENTILIQHLTPVVVEDL